MILGGLNPSPMVGGWSGIVQLICSASQRDLHPQAGGSSGLLGSPGGCKPLLLLLLQVAAGTIGKGDLGQGAARQQADFRHRLAQACAEC